MTGSDDLQAIHDALDRARSSATGAYTEETVIDGAVRLTSWVDYDLAQEVMDIRLGLHGPDLPRPTYDLPSMRVIISSDGVLMRNPGFEPDCGSPWVSFSRDSFEELTGMDVPRTATVHPVQLLEAHGDSIRRVTADTYEFTAPAIEVMPRIGSQSRPEWIELVANSGVTVSVHLEDGDLHVLESDLTTVMAELADTSAADGASPTEVMAYRWEFADRQLNVEPPSRTADASSCLGVD